MPKRFTDTEKWKDPWFCSLSPEQKLFWYYLLDNCDHAGIWKVNWPMVQFLVGQVDELEILAKFSTRIQIINPEKWFIAKFITFQQPGGLNPANKAHTGIIKILKTNNINLSPFLAPSKGLERGISKGIGISKGKGKKGGAGGKIRRDPSGDTPEQVQREREKIKMIYKNLKQNAKQTN